MRLLTRVALGATSVLALGFSSFARADVLELSQAGGLNAGTKAKPDYGLDAFDKAGMLGIAGPFLGNPAKKCVRGRFLVVRNNDGTPNIATVGDARHYFLFQLFDPSGNGKWITATPDGDGKPFHWSWVSSWRQEVDTWNDLWWLMSNRDKVYGNDVFAALEYAIDPDNSLGVSNAKVENPKTPPGNFQIIEGTISRYFISGRNYLRPDDGSFDAMKWGQDRITRVRTAHGNAAINKGLSPLDPDESDVGAEKAMTLLVEGMARFKRYPALDLDDSTPAKPMYVAPSARAYAQWIGERLAEAVVSPEQAQEVGRAHAPGRWIHDFAYASRRTLFALIDRASPEAIDQHLKRDQAQGLGAQDNLLVSSVGDPLRLDDFDVADSALDVLVYQDGQTGAESGLLTARKEDVSRLVEALLHCASGSDQIQGGQPINDKHRKVANKALQSLVVLAQKTTAQKFDTAGDAGLNFRQAIQDLFAKLPPESLKANAAREALIRAGFGSADEVRETLDRLFQIAIGAHDVKSARATEALDAIRALKKLTGDMGTVAQTEIKNHLQRLKARQDAAQGDADEKAVLDALSN